MKEDYEPDNVETRTQERPWQCDDCGLVHTHFPGYEHSLSAIARASELLLEADERVEDYKED